MNIFIEPIRNNKITSEIELKRLFWKISKKIHPDVTSLVINNDKFIQLKSDFDEARLLLCAQKQETVDKKIEYSKEDCVRLFIDLMASNFPIDSSIKNKKYNERIELLNVGLNGVLTDSKNVFKKFEEEMYNLKGNTVISNHLFNVVKLYLYRYCDYYYQKNKINKNYLTIGYNLIYEIFESKKMGASIQFLNWLVEEIIGKDKIRNTK